MKKIFAVVIVTPLLALFIGVGMLAFRVSDKWDERNTDVLISNITMICGVGGLVISLLLGSFIALVIYAYWRQNQQMMPPMWGGKPPRRSRLPDDIPPWMDAPPPLPPPDEPKGRLHTLGPSAYEDLDTSLFGDSHTISTEWSESQ